jgi:hypothetical protein
LLAKDNLTCGKIIKTATASAYYAKQEADQARWRYSYDELADTYKPKTLTSTGANARTRGTPLPARGAIRGCPKTFPT